MLPKKQTIKKFAHGLFVKVNFVDIYGRNVGFDYSYILDCIKAEYPNARTSRRWLQDMAYILNRTERLPVRRRSQRWLAEDYAMSLLLKRKGTSKSVYRNVRTTVKKKFPETRLTATRVRSLDVWLRNKGFPIPERQ